MIEKIKENKRKIIIIGIILLVILLIIIGIVIAKNVGKNSKINEIAKAEGEYGYDKPYIPEGFTYKEGQWNTGYVIEDSSTGNEFVWIPVDGTTVTLKRRGFSVSDIELKDAEESLDSIFSESVEKYGGYYVGRYESGVPTNSNFQEQEDMNVNGKPVSKKGATIWNNINYTNARNKCRANVCNKVRNN